ncbi:MAG: ABC transporter substrate-binding protein, partial [Chloroflexi bacterium]|nr:ABC transporter substrate-binding protein [Chloroflexota bacterium]
MSQRATWPVLTMMMVTVLLLASCGPRAAPAPTPAPSPAPGATVPAPAPIPIPAAPAPTEKPKYGGIINLVVNTESEVWDNTAVPRGLTPAGELVYESLVSPDWSQGLAGSGKVDWVGAVVGEIENWGPQLAESWETPELGTWILKIRRGVHYALNPQSEASRLMNGRELTADDVVWNINRLTKDPGGTTKRSNPLMSKELKVQKTGPWEVTVIAPAEPLTAWWWVIFGGNAQHILPREVVEKYGNAQDWRNVVGTGPFLLTDYIPTSVTTLVGNPNYWDKDPVGPGKGNQLPYVDTFKFFIIADTSTRLATMRTGRGDLVSAVESEDSKSLLRSNPELKSKRYLPGTPTIQMRIDKADLPFKDIRVRQALMMATDFESLKKDLYGGEAEILSWPVPPSYGDIYVPIEKLPESVQSLYKYNPEKAKQLLAEAGYPKGFKTRIIVQNVAVDMDPAAAYKAMWAKVGIDAEIQPREAAVYTSITTAGSWEEMLMGAIGAQAANMLSIYTFGNLKSQRVGGSATTLIDDPKIDQVYLEAQKHIIVNMPKVRQMLLDLRPYILEQAYVIPRVVPYSYT